MHADISRRTFDAADGYRSVVLQQGRVLLDADWNEQAEITTHHDETRMLDLVGRSAGPAPSGEATGVAALGPFAVVGPDGTVPDDETAPVAWVDLRVTPGRYYLDGVLAESSGPEVAGEAPDARGWQLTDQPYLATIGEGGSASPGWRSRAAPRTATGTRCSWTCGPITSPLTRTRHCSNRRSVGRTPPRGPAPSGRYASTTSSRRRPSGSARTCRAPRRRRAGHAGWLPRWWTLARAPTRA